MTEIILHDESAAGRRFIGALREAWTIIMKFGLGMARRRIIKILTQRYDDCDLLYPGCCGKATNFFGLIRFFGAKANLLKNDSCPTRALQRSTNWFVGENAGILYGDGLKAQGKRGSLRWQINLAVIWAGFWWFWPMRVGFKFRNFWKTVAFLPIHCSMWFVPVEARSQRVPVWCNCFISIGDEAKSGKWT